MSVQALKKYAKAFASLDVLKTFSPDSVGSFLLTGEDADALGLLARLVAARIGGISDEVALDGHADILVYPDTDDGGDKKESKSKKSGGDGKKARQAVMSVDDVKDIISSLYLTPFELKTRFYILENADTMNEACQNKLLKSLEEPPKGVCFLLCATRAMLPTVESRCREVRLAPFDTETVKTMLMPYYRDERAVNLAARASRGNIGMAERILHDKDYLSTYNSALGILKFTDGSRQFARAAAVYDKFTRDKTDTALGIMEYLLCDVSRALLGLDTVFDSADINSIAAGFTPYSAARCADFVREAKKHNDSNCMIPALMDELVLKIMEVKSLCKK